MKIKELNGVLILLLLAVACKNKEDNSAQILGKWQGTEWTFMGKPSGMDATQVHFDFHPDKTFNANSGPQYKSGTWRMSNDSLFTMEPGKKEVPIRLLKSDGTLLEMEMDIRGNKEIIKFKREQ